MKKIFTTVFIIFFYFLPKNVQSEIKPIIEGNIDAKVKLIVFESLTCSHCADFHKNIYPSLKEEFINKGHVSIEFKNFPGFMQQLYANKDVGWSPIFHYERNS